MVAVVVADTICLYTSFILAIVNEFVAPWSLPLSDMLSVTVTVSVAAVSVVAFYFS